MVNFKCDKKWFAWPKHVYSFPAPIMFIIYFTFSKDFGNLTLLIFEKCYRITILKGA